MFKVQSIEYFPGRKKGGKRVKVDAIQGKFILW